VFISVPRKSQSQSRDESRDVDHAKVHRGQRAEGLVGTKPGWPNIATEADRLSQGALPGKRSPRFPRLRCNIADDITPNREWLLRRGKNSFRTMIFLYYLFYIIYLSLNYRDNRNVKATSGIFYVTGEFHIVVIKASKIMRRDPTRQKQGEWQC
jgi:hypothetical protein